MANELSLWAGLGPKPKTPLRQYEPHGAGLKYSDAERKAWSIEQVRLAALRKAPGYEKPAPAKRASRAQKLEADTSGSSCFASLEYSDGVVTASFANPTIGDWDYEMSLKEAREWFNDESLGGFFNDNIR
jgi:hypothetical protein